MSVVKYNFKFVYQYTVGLLLPLYSVSMAGLYYYTEHPWYVYSCLSLVLLHVTFDLIAFYRTISMDYKIHHTIYFFSIISNYYTFTYFPPYMICVCISAEISTFFLSLKEFLPKKHWISNVNNAAFILSFLFFRMFAFVYYIIGNREFYKYTHNVPELELYSLFISFGLVFSLNSYWTILMIRMIYRKLFSTKKIQ